MLQNAALANGRVRYSSGIQSLDIIRLTITPAQNPKQREQLKSSLKTSDLAIKNFLKNLKILPYFKINVKPKQASK